MRTLILHLTNGEEKEWEVAKSLVDWSLWSVADHLLREWKTVICEDDSAVNLNHVVWMEEKKV